MERAMVKHGEAVVSSGFTAAPTSDGVDLGSMELGLAGVSELVAVDAEHLAARWALHEVGVPLWLDGGAALIADGAHPPIARQVRVLVDLRLALELVHLDARARLGRICAEGREEQRIAEVREVILHGGVPHRFHLLVLLAKPELRQCSG